MKIFSENKNESIKEMIDTIEEDRTEFFTKSMASIESRGIPWSTGIDIIYKSIKRMYGIVRLMKTTAKTLESRNELEETFKDMYKTPLYAQYITLNNIEINQGESDD